MALDKLTAQAFDFLGGALSNLSRLTYRYVRQEMSRHLPRFKRRLKKERMSGRPGIEAPFLSKGKHVATWVEGKDMQSLTANAKIGRVLKAHEEGRTIRPREPGGWLFIRVGPRRGKKVVGRIKELRIPARLGFKDLWNSMLPDLKTRIRNAQQRAIKVATDKAGKRVIKLVA